MHTIYAIYTEKFIHENWTMIQDMSGDAWYAYYIFVSPLNNTSNVIH